MKKKPVLLTITNRDQVLNNREFIGLQGFDEVHGAIVKM